MAQAKANATKSDLDVERYKPLVAKDVISKQQFDAAEAQAAANRSVVAYWLIFAAGLCASAAIIVRYPKLLSRFTWVVLAECAVISAERVRVSEAVSSYIVNLVRQSRQHAAVWVGAGPRATLALLSASRALAALEERDFVLPEDVKTLAAPVLEHRILLRHEFEMEGVEIREVINTVLETVEVPR